MSENNDWITLGPETSSAEDRLLKVLQQSDCQPFNASVVKSIRENVIDAPSLNSKVKEAIREAIRNAEGEGNSVPRSLVIRGAAGYGKTHLLCWARKTLMHTPSDPLPVYVSPYRADSGISVDVHLFRQLLKALEQSTEHQALFEQRVCHLAAEVYDDRLGKMKAADLGLQRSWLASMFSRNKTIAGRSQDDQVHALRNAVQQPAFADALARLLRAELNQELDRDVLLALIWFVIGDETEHWKAELWLQNNDLVPPERDRLHLRGWCRGPDRIAAAVATVKALLGRPICFCFDQVEEMITGFQQEDRANTDRHLSQLSDILTKLTHLDGIAFLFMCQQSSWDWLRRPENLREHVIDRLLEGTSPLVLEEVGRTAAQELVQKRMRTHVWNVIDEEPPEDNPFFPFTPERIEDLRLSVPGGELRDVITAFREEWKAICDPHGRGIHVRPPCQIDSVIPGMANSREMTSVILTGEHIPPEPRVWFGDVEAEVHSVSPDRKALTVLTPKMPPGSDEVSLRVTSQGADSSVEIPFRFLDEPLHKYFSGEKFRTLRKQQGHSQAKVGTAAMCSQPKVSQFERGISVPGKEMFEQLAISLNVEPHEICEFG